MALHRSEQVDKARTTLAEAIADYDAKATSARDQNEWTFHILRREAEAMIVP